MNWGMKRKKRKRKKKGSSFYTFECKRDVNMKLDLFYLLDLEV
jgi:hypothetical protein